MATWLMVARICATPPSDAHKHGVGNDGRDQVAAAGMRKGLWKRYGMARYPALAKVALRLLSIHQYQRPQNAIGLCGEEYIQLRAILWVSNVPRPLSCFVSTTAANCK
jgi:hypothetical protein